MIRLIGTVLIVVSTVEALVFVLAYHVTTGGGWRRTAAGRHLMAFTAALGLTLGLSLVRAWWTNTLWFQWFRLGVFGLVPLVLGQRIGLLIRAQYLTGKVSAWPSDRCSDCPAGPR